MYLGSSLRAENELFFDQMNIKNRSMVVPKDYFWCDHEVAAKLNMSEKEPFVGRLLIPKHALRKLPLVSNQMGVQGAVFKIIKVFLVKMKTTGIFKMPVVWLSC